MAKTCVHIPRNEDKFGRCKTCRSEKARLYYAANRETIQARSKEWRQNNPDRAKTGDAQRSVKYRYGLNPDEHKALSEEQNHQCAICKADTKLVVDHSHTTNKVRGLLCSSCNHGLGNFKDDISTLLRAVSYLEKN